MPALLTADDGSLLTDTDGAVETEGCEPECCGGGCCYCRTTGHARDLCIGAGIQCCIGRRFRVKFRATTRYLVDDAGRVFGDPAYRKGTIETAIDAELRTVEGPGGVCGVEVVTETAETTETWEDRDGTRTTRTRAYPEFSLSGSDERFYAAPPPAFLFYDHADTWAGYTRPYAASPIKPGGGEGSPGLTLWTDDGRCSGTARYDTLPYKDFTGAATWEWTAAQSCLASAYSLKFAEEQRLEFDPSRKFVASYESEGSWETTVVEDCEGAGGAKGPDGEPVQKAGCDGCGGHDEGWAVVGGMRVRVK